MEIAFLNDFRCFVPKPSGPKPSGITNECVYAIFGTLNTIFLHFKCYFFGILNANFGSKNAAIRHFKAKSNL